LAGKVNETYTAPPGIWRERGVLSRLEYMGCRCINKGSTPPGEHGFEATSGRSCIALDFDGTLILEHVPIVWVLFLLRFSNWTLIRRLAFMVKSAVRGTAALMLSRGAAWAPWAVRATFGAFKGVEVASLAALVHGAPMPSTPGSVHTLHLNPSVMTILRAILGSFRSHPEVHVYSQGSSREVVQRFLDRSDVRKCFNEIGVSPAAIVVHANRMIADRNGCFTGAVEGMILTKFNRLEMMPHQAVFIGDDEDERILNRLPLEKRIQFINWRRWEGLKTQAGRA